MSKTALNPKVSKISSVDSFEREKPKSQVIDHTVKSNYSTGSSNQWKKMTEEYETPSLIGEGLGTYEEYYYEPTTRDIEQEYLSPFMCGDDGMKFVADNSDVRITDHETIDIPSAAELCSLAKVNVYPVVQRYEALKKIITDLIDTTTISIAQGGMSQDEIESQKSYLNYLHDSMYDCQQEYEIAYWYWINERHDRELQRLEEEENGEWWV